MQKSKIYRSTYYRPFFCLTPKIHYLFPFGQVEVQDNDFSASSLKKPQHTVFTSKQLDENVSELASPNFSECEENSPKETEKKNNLKNHFS